jgi:hypothetical protein
MLAADGNRRRWFISVCLHFDPSQTLALARPLLFPFLFPIVQPRRLLLFSLHPLPPTPYVAAHRRGGARRRKFISILDSIDYPPLLHFVTAQTPRQTLNMPVGDAVRASRGQRLLARLHCAPTAPMDTSSVASCSAIPSRPQVAVRFPPTRWLPCCRQVVVPPNQPP